MDRQTTSSRIKDSFQSADISTQYPASNAGHSLTHTKWATSIAGITTAFCLSGCVTTSPRPVAVQPAPQPARGSVVVSNPPASRPPVAVRPVVVEQVLPEPNDVYISAAANSDVVFVGGDTYIWVTGPDGRRQRHFYAHGDRRLEVFHRRANLRSVAPPRPGHPAMRDARHEYAHHTDDAHRPQQVRVKGTTGQGHPPQHPMALDNQTHHSAQHGQHAPKQNPIVRAASTENSASRHRPEANSSATKNEAPPRT